MSKRFVLLLPAVILLTGCRSNSNTTGEPVADSAPQTHLADRVTRYTTSDPRLEPTLNVGGVLEVRTANGGPVVLQSQVDRQRKASEQLHATTPAAAPEVFTPGEPKK